MDPEPDIAGANERRPRGLRGLALVVVVTLVLGAAAAVAVSAQDRPARPSDRTDDPAVVLDQALSANTPVFVLIHSLT